MTEYIVKVENLAKLRKLAGLHVKETLELTSGKIVRCRDCKFYKHNSFHRCDLRMQAVEVEPDGFCAWADRKEGGDD